jgi:anti-anti-sigma regulatory factor
MANADFQHLRMSMVGDVALVEILSRNLQGPQAGLELGTDLAMVLAQDQARRILLDFRRAAFLSSSSFAALFKLVSKARAGGQAVKFCGMAPGVLAGAEVVGLPKVVEILEDQLTGLKAFLPPVAGGANHQAARPENPVSPWIRFTRNGEAR